VKTKAPVLATFALIAASNALVTRPAPAEWSPLWIAQLPAGSALTAGLQGMVTDSNGVSYITGITGPSSNTDILTAAFAPDGTVLWQHVFNGPADWHDQARGIGLGPGGVVYVTGNTPGTGFYANVLLLKYDAATGALLDTVQYSSGLFMSEHGACVATDAADCWSASTPRAGSGGRRPMTGLPLRPTRRTRSDRSRSIPTATSSR
jgi:hypothetical protein